MFLGFVVVCCELLHNLTGIADRVWQDLRLASQRTYPLAAASVAFYFFTVFSSVNFTNTHLLTTNYVSRLRSLTVQITQPQSTFGPGQHQAKAAIHPESPRSVVAQETKKNK